MQNTYDNQAQLLGTIVQDPLYSHSLYGENFYTFALHVKRLSDTADVLPVTVSERILGKAKSGQIVRVFGQVRSYNACREPSVSQKRLFALHCMGENGTLCRTLRGRNPYLLEGPNAVTRV